jgi:hypothetical protein
VLALVGVALIVVAAAVAAVFALGASNGRNSDAAYKQKVASAFGPVLGANRQVSDALARLRGTKANSARGNDARVAVRRAQQATTLATGAVGALSVPEGSDQLARDARQALDRESAYFAEIARVLARPASASTSGLAELASNLTSALSVAGPTVAGSEPTVGGSDRLARWARAIRIKANRKKGQQAAGRPAAGGGSSLAASQSAPASTPARNTDCGGVVAGPNTSCAFAANVHRAWQEAPGRTNTVRVFSPVTGQTYTMSCAPSGSGITCSGANNASVTFEG